jgi:hypothetical protein
VSQPTDAHHTWIARVLGIDIVPRVPATPNAFKQMLDAVQTLADAQAEADKQLSELQTALRKTDDAALQRIAEFGLNGITGKVRVSLQAAIFALTNTGSASDLASLRKAAEAAGQYADLLRSDRRVRACDGNPFGVHCALARTLIPPLQRLRKALATAEQSI